MLASVSSLAVSMMAGFSRAATLGVICYGVAYLLFLRQTAPQASPPRP